MKIVITLALFLQIFYVNAQTKDAGVIKYVNTLIGTEKGGNTFQGATRPYSMVKVGPDWSSTIRKNESTVDDKIFGFSHTRVSGTGGGGKYGNILITPFTGNPSPRRIETGWKDLVTTPGYYAMTLPEFNVRVELTSTPRAAFHKYTFRDGTAKINVDAGYFIGASSCCGENQRLIGSEVRILSENEIEGYSKVEGGWGIGVAYTVYFYIITETPATSIVGWRNGKLVANDKQLVDHGDSTGAILSFGQSPNKPIQLKIGLSYISTGKARENLLNEINGWDFDKIKEESADEWNRELSRIIVEGDDKWKRIYYSAVYHSMMTPVNKTGENPKWKSKAPYYDDFYAVWDTYRTLHPFLTLTDPLRQAEIIQSLLAIYQHEGYMPDARAGDDNGRTQGGSDADILIADAYAKGLKGIDYELALKAMVKNAEVPPGDDERKHGRGGVIDYNRLGYVPFEVERSGNRTVEYSVCDYSIAQLAKGLGKTELYNKYLTRSGNWKNLWRPITNSGATGFIMPKSREGKWIDSTYQFDWDTKKSVLKPFSVHTFGTWPDVFYEGNAWIYSFAPTHDVEGLIKLSGGKEAFVARLDTFFIKNYFDMSNEPSFFTPSLYSYAGRYPKTAQRVRAIATSFFNDGPGGIPGNEDSGAMSTWIAFQAMGIYPNAGTDLYLINSPILNKSTIKLANGKTFVINAPETTDKNIYVTGAKLNGKVLDRCWLKHEEIIQGGVLELKMGSKAGTWGTVNLPR